MSGNCFGSNKTLPSMCRSSWESFSSFIQYFTRLYKLSCRHVMKEVLENLSVAGLEPGTLQALSTSPPVLCCIKVNHVFTV